MSDEQPERWPLLPSHSAGALHGLCLALADVVRDEITGEISRRAIVKVNGLAVAAELFAGEVVHFFGSRMGADHDQLEALQENYLQDNSLRAKRNDV